MGEKLFNCVLGKDYHIINNNVNNMTYYLQDGNDVVLVINLLNRLVEEKEYFERKKEYFLNKWSIVKAKNIQLRQEIKELKKENRELRQQHQRLYNYFRDYLEDEMSAESFGEMWDTVKVDERWNE